MTWTAQDQPSQITKTEHDLSGLEVYMKDLEGKTEAQLKGLYTDAVTEEAAAKTELYQLRQRVANLGTDFQTDEEILLSSAKQRVASALSYVKALSIKLEGTPSTPTVN